MKDDLQTLLNQIDDQEMEKTIRWLTTNTPYRLSGSADEKKASEYVAGRLADYGLEVINEEFYIYNSEPIRAKVALVAPLAQEFDSLPYGHIRSTKEGGAEFELVYAGDGAVESYDGLEVAGKMVLLEVSYAPPVPEKARIAHSMGAAGIICMNWGNDEEVICNRGLKAVWGNPTADTLKNMPDIIGVGVTRGAGLKLKEVCRSGAKPIVRVEALSERKWSKVHQPTGILRGNGKRGEFVLVCSHLDAWEPGVTCNATGNATTLEICRLLAQRRETLDRDIYFVFWNGHEVAEAAGSTWFVDHYWDKLSQNCVAYMHIDSTGVSETSIYEIKASDELIAYAEDNFKGLYDEPLRSMPLKKIGDQSFMGIGVPSITQRMSFTEGYMKKNHGATLGWWNHTIEDGLDKWDKDILYQDTIITLSCLYNLINCQLLPYDFQPKLAMLKMEIDKKQEEYGGVIDLREISHNLDVLAELLAQANDCVSTAGQTPSAQQVQDYNDLVKGISRNITNVFHTYTDKFQQDSYGYGKLAQGIPLLADLASLPALDPESLEYGMAETQLVKNKNRINDGLLQSIRLAKAYVRLLATG